MSQAAAAAARATAAASPETTAGHAGAGSILEGLRQRAVLVVVVNDLLMDNHQAELAHALHTRGHVIATTPSQLVATLRDLHARAPRLVPLPDADPSAFGRFLETELGI